MPGWIDWSDPDDRDYVVGVWPDAELADDGVIVAVLAAAGEQCAQFAPPLASAATPPNRYRHAQALQARALAQAGSVQVSGDLDGAYPIQTFPMDWTVKALLRPAGVPRIG